MEFGCDVGAKEGVGLVGIGFTWKLSLFVFRQQR